MLYVLRLSHGKFYVGISSKPLGETYQDHLNGRVSVWTKMHPPIGMGIYFCRPVLSPEPVIVALNREICMMMLLFGIQNVRGGEYSDPKDFTDEQANQMVSRISTVLGIPYGRVRMLGLPRVYSTCLVCGADKPSDAYRCLCAECWRLSVTNTCCNCLAPCDKGRTCAKCYTLWRETKGTKKIQVPQDTDTTT